MAIGKQWTFINKKLIDKEYFRIWKQSAPGSHHSDDPKEPLPHPHHPSIQVYLPPSYYDEIQKEFPVMIVLPGGGYSYLSEHEAIPPAEWLIQLDIVVFILRYRLGPLYHYPIQLYDVQRAIRFIRFHSLEWNLNPDQIGLLGFSAGGHLASLASTHFNSQELQDLQSSLENRDVIDDESARPDLHILIYPVIDFIHTYQPCSSLLGNDPHPSRSILRNLSTHLFVSNDTPPAFLCHTIHDELVPIHNSIVYIKALQRHNVSVEFIKGDWAGHGFGLSPFWTFECQDWIQNQWNL